MVWWRVLSLDSALNPFDTIMMSGKNWKEKEKSKMEKVIWFCLLICNIMIPITAVIGGYWFVKKAPREISAFGYRSVRSLKSKEAWSFAQGCFGMLWEVIGIATLLPSLAIAVFFYFMTLKQQCILTLILVTVQIVLLCFSIFIVERALKSHFDENGKAIKKEESHRENE